MRACRKVVWCLCVSLLAGLMMTSQAVDQSRVVVCYYSSWAHYRQGVARYRVEDIPTHLCTHLVYAFAVLDSNTLLAKSHDMWLDLDLNNFQKFVKLKKKNPKLKVLLGLGGWNDSRSTKYSQLVSEAAHRRAFTNHILTFLLQYGFDGLDLDWEYPGYESKPSDKEGFTAWLEDLKDVLSPRGLLLTAAVSAGRWVVDRGYNVPRVAQLLDLLFLMSYAFHGSWESRVAHHAPLYPEPGQNKELCVDFAVNYWIKKGAPASKLVMGVPLYGQSWTLADSKSSGPGAVAVGAGRPGWHTKTTGNMAFFECCLSFLQEGWSKVVGVGGPYITKSDQWVGYDDIQAVTEKAQYAVSHGLAGVMVWDLPSDDFGDLCGYGTNPLLTAIAKTISISSQSPLGLLDSSLGPYDSAISGDPSKGPTNSSVSPDSGSSTSSLVFPRPFTLLGGDRVGENLVEDSVEDEGNVGDKHKKVGEWRPGEKNNIRPSLRGQEPDSGNQSTNDIYTISADNDSGNDINTTPKLPYEWLAWPIFSQPQSYQRPKPSAIPRPSTPSDSYETSNSIRLGKPYDSKKSKLPNSIPASIPFITKPAIQVPGQRATSGTNIKPPSSPQWFASCASLGFAPDPVSCNHFYTCTNGIVYRFDCPGGLLWHQAETSCDWPQSAPCTLT